MDSCDKGQGLFQVFVGDIADDNLVIKGSKFQRLQHFDINLFDQSSYTTSTGKMITYNDQPPTTLPQHEQGHSEPTEPTEPTMRNKESNAIVAAHTSYLLIFVTIFCTSLFLLQ